MIFFEDAIFKLIFFEILIFIIIILNYKKISKKLKLFDFPNVKRKIHNNPVSVIGGVLLYLIISINSYYFGKYYELNNLFLISTFIIITAFFLIGYLDDLNKLKLNPKIYLILFFIFFLISINQNFIISKVYIEYFDKNVFLFNFSLVFTLLCIFLLFNAINLMDGANGILLGFFLFFYTIFFWKTNFIFYSVNIFLILILIIFNLRTKLFSGNSGANSISIFFAVVIITSYNYDLQLNSEKISAELIFIILIIPGLDMLRVFSERIFNNINPFKADNNHFHHLLMKKINKKYVFIPYLIFSILPYCLVSTGMNKILIISFTLILYTSAINYLKKI